MGWKSEINRPIQIFIGWGDRNGTGNIAEEVTEHVQMQIYQRYLESNEPEMLQGNGKNWLSSRDWLRGNHLEGAWWGPKKARRPLQMVHGWLPTRGMIAKREYPGTEGEKCPNCKSKETTWHAMGECNHAASCTARDKGIQETNAIIDCEALRHADKKLATMDILGEPRQMVQKGGT